MRRLLTGLSLAAICVLGGLAGGCQPTKPCRCVQSEGCRCPLPPPAKKAASAVQRTPAHAQEPETPVPWNGQRARGKMATAQQTASGEAGISHREYPGRSRSDTRLSRHQHTPAGQARAEGVDTHAEMERREGQAIPHEHPVHRRTLPPSSRSGGALSSDYVPRNDQDQEYPIPPPAPMSINAPDALDPWHGYDADCPERTED